MNYKVIITTSGVGSRLGELTKFTNKCLIRVGKKPAISYIVEKYPDDIEIIITLGYYGNHVKDFLSISYPNKKFKFVEVPNFEGLGSSLANSLLFAKNELRCPFIFHACDSIVDEEITPPHFNWIGVSYRENVSQYRTYHKSSSGIINEKGDLMSNLAYIGVAGIFDFDYFWEQLEISYKENQNDYSISDCHAINKMTLSDWKVVEFKNWLDIGNVDELVNSRKKIKDKFDILDKVDESIFIFDKFVIKFFYDKKICRDRTYRGKKLYPLSPLIIDSRENFYKYEFINGNLLSHVVDIKVFKEFLDWSSSNLWVKKQKNENFKFLCEKFYINKTLDRLNIFLKKMGIEDKEEIINGILVPSVTEMISKIDLSLIHSESPYQFHGDFILDNIIKTEDGFCLIDWRQDFAGDLDNGDIYYDLSKLNHNLTFNHDIVNNGNFYVEKNNNIIRCDIHKSFILDMCKEILEDFTNKNGLNWKKIQILTSLIWINMSPLHEPKLGEFLYYFGKLNLFKNLNI